MSGGYGEGGGGYGGEMRGGAGAQAWRVAVGPVRGPAPRAHGWRGPTLRTMVIATQPGEAIAGLRSRFYGSLE